MGVCRKTLNLLRGVNPEREAAPRIVGCSQAVLCGGGTVRMLSGILPKSHRRAQGRRPAPPSSHLPQDGLMQTHRRASSPTLCPAVFLWQLFRTPA